MTNREWMESLSNEDLAHFLTIGLQRKYVTNVTTIPYYTYYESISDISRNYTNSTLGVLDWLSRGHMEEVK